MVMDLDVQEAMLRAGLAEIQRKRMQQEQQTQTKTRKRYGRINAIEVASTPSETHFPGRQKRVHTAGIEVPLTPSDMDSAASKKALVDLKRADITRR